MSQITPRIVAAENDMLMDEQGHQTIDLFSANGTTWLGHRNPSVNQAVKRQIDSVWITGGLGSAIVDEAKASIESFFPPSHRVVGLYSTGMEAAEFAIRLARRHTGRNGIIGFEHCMHGKSMAMSCLCWGNFDEQSIPSFVRLPFVTPESEDALLGRLDEAFEQRQVAAVLLEPIQGSAGMHLASPHFCEALLKATQSAGAVAVFDEVLTGFFRTGSAFVFSELNGVPDVILIGKAMGNGFPVSAVVAHRSIDITPAMLPGSTFAGNPLAAAAVSATLRDVRKMDLPSQVREIQKTIVEQLGELPEQFTLRGLGAMWCIELSPAIKPKSVAESCYHRGAMVNYAGNFVRILPAATIELENLKSGCGILREALLRASHE
jgi:acetylornithine/succinyldiaminopimelate/putrescine aminotransferase